MGRPVGITRGPVVGEPIACQLVLLLHLLWCPLPWQLPSLASSACPSPCACTCPRAVILPVTMRSLHVRERVHIACELSCWGRTCARQKGQGHGSSFNLHDPHDDMFSLKVFF